MRSLPQGLRPIQIWVSDVHSPSFQDQAHRQCRAVAQSAYAEDDQAFIDTVSAIDLGSDAE